ncbi:MAG TPA: carboxylating nicotinate-nucleotide diphosphorylase [Kiritimatiellia bacterium]|nr:carboxylating nicotinate-nucleotide diphosphorylase [Kiritimatiellia bacterium]HPS09135.1 carboxylating nicotinate-nucleotide diphosphorylase [Kiritimatiellia bacterium]
MGTHDLMRDPRAVRAVEAALAEDIGPGDATTLALVDATVMATGEILAREACRVAGVTVGQKVLETVDPALRVEVVVPDGRDVAKGGTILTIRGKAASILVAERTALNFMQRMCGIATLTARFVEAVKEYGTLILDTRKTTPNLRLFEKYAVACGGGTNHRFGLYDRVLVKDNHRRLWQGGDPDRLDLAVAAARKAYPELAVEIEVESVAECRSALRGKPEWIMLDNMGCDMMRECVALCKGISKTEASGGITLNRAREVAATGVDAISLGCLTHSAPSVDLSLEWSVA